MRCCQIISWTFTLNNRNRRHSCRRRLRRRSRLQWQWHWRIGSKGFQMKSWTLFHMNSWQSTSPMQDRYSKFKRQNEAINARSYSFYNNKNTFCKLYVNIKENVLKCYSVLKWAAVFCFATYVLSFKQSVFALTRLLFFIESLTSTKPSFSRLQFAKNYYFLSVCPSKIVSWSTQRYRNILSTTS